jgi:hypothetical protein
LFVLGTDLEDMEEEKNLHLPAGRLSTCTRSRVCVSAYFTQFGSVWHGVLTLVCLDGLQSNYNCLHGSTHARPGSSSGRRGDSKPVGPPRRPSRGGSS